MSFLKAKKSREKSLKKLTEDIHARLNISECLTFGSALRKYYDGTITDTELNAEVESLLSHHPDLLQRFPIFTTSQLGGHTLNLRDDVTEISCLSTTNSFNDEATGENLDKACLHNLLSSPDPELDHVKRLIVMCPDAITELDASGKLPLHTACIRGASYEVIQALVDACPEAISISDDSGRIPLHYYVTFTNSGFKGSRFSTTLNLYARKKFTGLAAKAITLLGASDFMMQEDNDGITPLNSFAYKCHLIGKRDQESYAKAKQIIDAFLDPCPPIEGIFLDTIRAFPYKLVKHIANNENARERLNEQAIRPFYFGTIVLDLVVRVAICILFLIANEKTIQDTNDGVADPGHDEGLLPLIYTLYFGSIYQFIRVGTRLMSFLAVEDSVQWASDGWHWIHLIESCFVFVSVILMHLHPDNYEKVNVMATIASGIQWVSILVVLKPANLKMVLFWKGLLNVVKTMVPFLLSSGVILFAFASMFFLTAYDNMECKMQEDSSFPCTFQKAFDLVMNNFANSEIDEDSFQHDFEYSALSGIFAMVVIILQLNILIAVVTDAFSAVHREGKESFWLERLYYASEARHLKRLFMCEKALPVTNSSREKLEDSMKKKWTECCDIILHRRQKKLVAYRKLGLKGETNLIKKILFTLKQLILVFVCILWVVFGFVTLGVFLPPQVKAFMVFEKVCDEEKDTENVMTQEEMLEMVTKEIQKQMTDTNANLDLILKSLSDMQLKITSSEEIQSNEKKTFGNILY